LTEAATKPGSCQVRSRTENPCPRRAEAEIQGVAFCGPCAREQEAYFAIGELTQEETDGPYGMALAEALKTFLRRAQRTRGDRRTREMLIKELHC
jgi:hypothetical protein